MLNFKNLGNRVYEEKKKKQDEFTVKKVSLFIYLSNLITLGAHDL